MGALIEKYRSWTRTLGGTPKTFGNFTSPHSSVETATTTGAAHDETVPVVAGATVTLWDYNTSSFKDWATCAVEFAGGSGTLYLAWMNDEATSASNNNPKGTSVTWDKLLLTENGTHDFSTRNAITNPVASDHASNNAGLPLAFTDPGEVAGYIYKIVVKNPGTTDLLCRCLIWG